MSEALFDDERVNVRIIELRYTSETVQLGLVLKNQARETHMPGGVGLRIRAGSHSHRSGLCGRRSHQLPASALHRRTRGRVHVYV